MSNPTSNFGWQMPTNSDLVTDLPADFEVFGQGVDTTLADLKGGTTGQMLTKTSNTDMDFTWVTPQIGDITAITATSPLTGGGTSGDVTVGIQAASTSQSGAVQLTDSTSSTSTSTAATPNSVKSAYDLANAAIPKSLADAKGDLIVGTANDTFARLAVGGNGSALVSDSTTGSGLAYSNANTRGNPVINSAMDIWQRGTSVSASGSQFGPDRWNSYRGGYAAGITVSRQVTGDTTNLPDIQYCARVQRDSGNTSISNLQFENNFETINSIPYSGKTVTISFYARAGANYSASSSVLTANLYSGTGTDQALRNGLTGQTSVTSLNASLTTTWQRFTFSGTVGTTATQLVVAFSYVPTGTAGAADYFEITGVQLDLSSTAITFRRSSTTIQGELAACQRYYVRFANTSNANATVVPSGITYSATTFPAVAVVPTTLRTNPTSIEYANLQIIDSTFTQYTITNVAISQNGNPFIICDFTASGMTAGRSGWVRQSSTSGYLAFNAEL